MCAVFSSGMRKHNPAARSVQAMFGKVKRSSERRPNVSIVQMAGYIDVSMQFQYISNYDTCDTRVSRRVYVHNTYPSENEINKTEAEGSDQGLSLSDTRLSEDGGRIKRDDINAAPNEQDQ